MELVLLEIDLLTFFNFKFFLYLFFFLDGFKSKYVHVYNKYHKIFFLYSHFLIQTLFKIHVFFAAVFRVKFTSFLYEQAFQNKLGMILMNKTYFKHTKCNRRKPKVGS